MIDGPFPGRLNLRQPLDLENSGSPLCHPPVLCVEALLDEPDPPKDALNGHRQLVGRELELDEIDGEGR
jgi:hypothetical protein